MARKLLTIRLSPEDWRRLIFVADRRGQTFSSVVRELLAKDERRLRRKRRERERERAAS